MITYYDWETRQVSDALGNKVSRVGASPQARLQLNRRGSTKSAKGKGKKTGAKGVKEQDSKKAKSKAKKRPRNDAEVCC